MASRILNSWTAMLPQNRCLDHGPQCLSLKECLALLILSDADSSLLLERAAPGLSADTQERAFFTTLELSASALIRSQDWPLETQARLLAAVELARRYSVFRDQNRSKAPSRLPATLPYLALRKVGQTERSESREWLGFVPYYRHGELGGLCVLERGLRTHVNVDPADLFARILALRPEAFFLVHNHPSGSLMPSKQDFLLTDRIGTLAQQLGLRLLGHWIVTAGSERFLPAEPG